MKKTVSTVKKVSTIKKDPPFTPPANQPIIPRGRLTKKTAEYDLSFDYIESVIEEAIATIRKDMEEALAAGKDYIYRKGKTIATVRKVQKEKRFEDGATTPNIYICTLYTDTNELIYTELFEEKAFESFLVRFFDFAKAYVSVSGVGYVSSHLDPHADVYGTGMNDVTDISMSRAFANSQAASLLKR